MSTVYQVVKWVEANGEVKAIDRLRVALLPDLLGEGIRLVDVSPTTPCSPSLLKKISDQAEAIVGRPCCTN